MEAVLEKKEVEDTAKYKNVTEEEAEKPKKMKSEVHLGIGLPIVYFNKNNSEDNPFYGINLFLFWETEDFRTELFYTYARSSKTVDDSIWYGYEYEVFAVFGICFNYFIYNGSIFSAYLGAGISIGEIKPNDSSSSSSLNEYYEDRNTIAYIPVKVGLEAFRLYDLRLFFEVTGFLPLEKQTPVIKPGDNLENLEKKWMTPTSISINISYGFDTD